MLNYYTKLGHVSLTGRPDIVLKTRPPKGMDNKKIRYETPKPTSNSISLLTSYDEQKGSFCLARYCTLKGNNFLYFIQRPVCYYNVSFCKLMCGTVYFLIITAANIILLLRETTM